MDYQLFQRFSQSYLECLPGYSKLASGDEALELIVACGQNNTNKLMLQAENFTPDFFRLRTGVAGEILQKFSIYHIQVAAVLTPELVNQGRFREMVLEANRGNQFHVFYNRESAERWLIGV